MKIIGLILILTFLIFSCKKEVNSRKMTVIKNCTGLYLEFKDENFKVCNRELLDNFENNEKVRASFKILSECQIPSPFVCEMFFDFKEDVEVTSIK